MNKKGAGHIEVIVAFILFVGFLIFGLYFFNPLDSKRVLDSSLSYSAEEVMSNVSTNVAHYSIVVSELVDDVIIELPLSRGNIPGSGVTVMGLDGTSFKKNIANTRLVIDRQQANNRFFTVTFGDFRPSLTPLPPGTVLSLTDGYSISSSSVDEIIGEKEVRALKVAYETNYDMLKKEFNIPGRVDFDFSLDFSDGTSIEATRSVPEGIEVVVSEASREVLREDGSIVFATLVVRVW